uniref:Uncharacterized protein n=1 Tax=Glossina brevipalpis TaxID=37001 RepID=A0A1A9WCW9_9MUSC
MEKNKIPIHSNEKANDQKVETNLEEIKINNEKSSIQDTMQTMNKEYENPYEPDHNSVSNDCQISQPDLKVNDEIKVAQSDLNVDERTECDDDDDDAKLIHNQQNLITLQSNQASETEKFETSFKNTIETGDEEQENEAQIQDKIVLITQINEPPSPASPCAPIKANVTKDIMEEFNSLRHRKYRLDSHLDSLVDRYVQVPTRLNPTEDVRIEEELCPLQLPERRQTVKVFSHSSSSSSTASEDIFFVRLSFSSSLPEAESFSSKSLPSASESTSEFNLDCSCVSVLLLAAAFFGGLGFFFWLGPGFLPPFPPLPLRILLHGACFLIGAAPTPTPSPSSSARSSSSLQNNIRILMF